MDFGDATSKTKSFQECTNSRAVIEVQDHWTKMANPESLPFLSQNPDRLPLTDRHATRIWFFAEGTRIYLLILTSTCFVAASDPPFKASLTRLYKDFLCCQQDPTKCHDRIWCEIESGNATERDLSRLFRSQSIFNAGGGMLTHSARDHLTNPRY